jgi:hypothetical protein
VSRDQGPGPGLPPALLGLMAAAAHAGAQAEGGDEAPPRMLEARIYAPGSPDAKPIAVLKEEQIAGHDPSVRGLVEVLDAETGRRRFWIGFPYTVVEEPAPQSRVHAPPGAGRIIGG